MKESPERNYRVEVRSLAGAVSPEMHQLQPRGFLVTINGVVDIALIESLRAVPWPPPPPRSHDRWNNAEEAAEYLFEVSSITIAPSSGHLEVRHAVGEVGLEHTAFFLRRAEFEALRSDVEAILRLPVARNSVAGHRLEHLRGRPLADFLMNKLREAKLGAYKRSVLCLEPAD